MRSATVISFATCVALLLAGCGDQPTAPTPQPATTEAAEPDQLTSLRGGLPEEALAGGSPVATASSQPAASDSSAGAAPPAPENLPANEESPAVNEEAPPANEESPLANEEAPAAVEEVRVLGDPIFRLNVDGVAAAGGIFLQEETAAGPQVRLQWVQTKGGKVRELKGLRMANLDLARDLFKMPEAFKTFVFPGSARGGSADEEYRRALSLMKKNSEVQTIANYSGVAAEYGFFMYNELWSDIAFTWDLQDDVDVYVQFMAALMSFPPEKAVPAMEALRERFASMYPEYTGVLPFAAP